MLAVLRVRRFATFREMLQVCGVPACLPDLEGGIDEAVAVYQSFGSTGGESFADLERRCGVVAFDVLPLG